MRAVNLLVGLKAMGGGLGSRVIYAAGRLDGIGLWAIGDMVVSGLRLGIA
jgi:hypothetical protein